MAPHRHTFPREGDVADGRVRRRSIAAIAVLVTISVAGCDVKANGEDARRVAKLRSYELLRTAPTGSTLTDKPTVIGAKVADPKDSDGGIHNGHAAWTTTESLASAAHFYADALIKQGWQDVKAYCSGPPPEGRGFVRLWGGRNEGRYNTSAGVELLRPTALSSVVEINLFVHAPFHNDRGTPPVGNSPDLACIDRMAVP